MYKKRRKDGGKEQAQMTRSLDMLRQVEMISTLILPQIQQDLANGMSAEEIMSKYAPYAAARQVTIALTSEDDGKASAAADKLVQQTLGKPKEKKEVKHQFEDLPDEELDALVKSKLKLLTED